MTLAHLIVISVGFILLNGAFVAAEFALIAAPKTAIEHHAGQGHQLASRLLAVLESPVRQDRYIATAQLGITLASLGLGMYAEHTLAEMIAPHLGTVPFFGAVAAAGVLALSLLTFLHIVFGEMVPKTLALQHAERAARWAYWPMFVTLVLLYPAVRLSSGLARGLLRLVGIRRQENVVEQTYTPEELQLIVEESERSGALRAESGKLMRELFEFGDLVAEQVMVPRVRVVGVPADATIDDIRALLQRAHHTRYPVFEGDLDHITGMVHVKDLLRRMVAGHAIAAGDVRPMPVVPTTAALDDVLSTMQRANAHMAMVVDEHGGTAGVVTLEDLFEEVVGELEEGAPESPSLASQPDGSVVAAGTVRLDELGQHFDLSLEHEEVDSVSGLVLARLDRSPLVGDVVDYGRLRLQVTETSGRGVREVRAWLLNEDDTAEGS